MEHERGADQRVASRMHLRENHAPASLSSDHRPVRLHAAHDVDLADGRAQHARAESSGNVVDRPRGGEVDAHRGTTVLERREHGMHRRGHRVLLAEGLALLGEEHETIGVGIDCQSEIRLVMSDGVSQ